MIPPDERFQPTLADGDSNNNVISVDMDDFQKAPRKREERKIIQRIIDSVKGLGW